MILKLLLSRKIGSKSNMKHISKEKSWAAPLILPNKAYLELLDHPAKIMPKTLNDDIDKKNIKFKYSSK